jgi:hypothetical protein
MLGVPMMAVTLLLVTLIPEQPLRRAVRDDVTRPEAPTTSEQDRVLAA